MTNKTPKLAEIARGIEDHLKRIEMAQPDRGNTWNILAIPSGNRIRLTYESYQNSWSLTKSDALEYLAWLDAGNIGRHYQALSFNKRIREEVATS